MKRSKIIFAALAVVLAVSSAFVSKGSAKDALALVYVKDGSGNCIQVTCAANNHISCVTTFANQSDCQAGTNGTNTSLKYN